jgi:hypothetical protein
MTKAGSFGIRRSWGRRNAGQVGGATSLIIDRPRLVTPKQEERERAIDEELGRKPRSRPITLPRLKFLEDE